jgi:hypothetical protein
MSSPATYVSELHFRRLYLLSVQHELRYLVYNQQDAAFSRSIYFYKLLYVFQAVLPLIIRSIELYIQRQVLPNQYCCLLLSWMRWNAVPSHP